MRWLIPLLLAGCTEPASDSSLCGSSPELHFVRANGLPEAVAVGGTATFQLQCWFTDYPGEAPFDVPSVATTEPDPAASVDKGGATLVIAGVHAGTTTVQIISSDGATLYGSLEVEVAAVDHLAFRTGDTPANMDVAFAKELGTLAEVMLEASNGDLLADDAMQLVPPSAAVRTAIRPGVFDYTATPLGDYVVEVDSAGTSYTLPFVVVDHADSVTLADPSVTIPVDGSDKSICFGASLDARFVSSLRWSFVTEAFPAESTNCLPLTSAADTNHDGMVAISASAGGASGQVNVPVR
jgi:hypothetical protein